MRFALPALLCLTGCAAMSANSRPATVFPPLPDDAPVPSAQDQARVTVLEHVVLTHPGCYAVQRENGAGIIRCGGGQLEWLVTRGIAEGVDDFDSLKDAMKSDAERSGSAVEEKQLECTVGGAPADCRAYAFNPKDGSPARVTLIGLAQLSGRSLVAQCVAKAGQSEAMKPVCGEAFSIK